MFYDRFKELCDENKISPSAVAKDLDISKSSVTYWKDKNTSPREDILIKIADYFKVSIDYLLGQSDTKKQPTKDDRLSQIRKLIVKMYSELTPDKQQAVLDYIRFLASNPQEKE